MIEYKNVSASYGNEEVLHDVSFSVEPGKLTVIIGPNGCGKSTLLKTLIRYHVKSKGSIFINGKSIESFDSTSLAQKIAYLPQDKKAVNIQVNRMVLHGRFAYLKYPRRYRKEDYEIVSEALKQVGIEELAHKYVSQLSGGTQQKVYIAMALAQDTPTILMDEPTAYLDISHQLKVMELGKKLTSQGKTVVMVLHDLMHALRFADQIVVMSFGRIVSCGTPEEIYHSGILNQVFHVNIERVMTATGWQYFINHL